MSDYLSTDPNFGLEPSKDSEYLSTDPNFGLEQPPEKKDAGIIGNAVQRVGDVAISLAKGVVTVPQTAVGVADILSGGQAGKSAEDAGVRFKDTQDILDNLKSPAQKEADKQVSQADGFVDTAVAAIQNPSTIVNTSAESIPSMFLGGAGARAGVMGISAISKAVAEKAAPILAGVGEGVVTAGQIAEQIRSENKDGLLTDKQSAASAGAGILTGIIGAAAGRLAQSKGWADIQTMIANGGADSITAKAAKDGFFKSVIKSGFSEGVLEELPQSSQEQMWQNWAQGKPVMEGVGNQAAMGMLSGAAMGAAGGGYSAATRQPDAVDPNAPPVADPANYQPMSGQTVPVDLSTPPATPNESPSTVLPIGSSNDVGTVLDNVPANNQPDGQAGTQAPVVDHDQAMSRLSELEIQSEHRDLTPQEQAEYASLAQTVNQEDQTHGVQETGQAPTQEINAGPDQASAETQTVPAQDGSTGSVQPAQAGVSPEADATGQGNQTPSPVTAEIPNASNNATSGSDANPTATAGNQATAPADSGNGSNAEYANDGITGGGLAGNSGSVPGPVNQPSDSIDRGTLDGQSQNTATQESAAEKAVEKYQWTRNKEGGQEFGNQQEIRPLTKEIFDKHMADKVQPNTFEEYAKKYPNVTHVLAIKKHGGGFEYGSVGSLESLRPEGEPLKRGWVKRVDSFESDDAVKHGKLADSEITQNENPTNQASPALPGGRADSGTDATGVGASQAQPAIPDKASASQRHELETINDKITELQNTIASRTESHQQGVNDSYRREIAGLEKQRDFIHGVIAEDAQPAKTAKPAKPAKKAKPKVLISDSDDLLAVIAKLGGINRDEAKSQGIDPASFGKRGYGIMRVFNSGKSSDTFDGMQERVRQYGFDVNSANELLDMVTRAVNQGEMIYNAAGHELQAERAAKEQYTEEEAAFSIRVKSLLDRARESLDEKGYNSFLASYERGSITPDEIAGFEQDLEDDIDEHRQSESAANPDASAGTAPAGSGSKQQEQPSESKPRTDASAEKSDQGSQQASSGISDDDLFFAYKADASRIQQFLHDAGKLGDLIRQAGLKKSDSFDGLPITDQAKAYVKYVRAGNQPVIPEQSYNDWVASAEKSAENKRNGISDEAQTAADLFKANPQKIVNELTAKGQIKALHDAAGVMTSAGFKDLQLADKIAAYVKMVTGETIPGAPKPKGKPVETDLFVNSEAEQKALDAKQAIADVAGAKDAKRKGNGAEPPPLFSDNADMAGQVDLEDAIKQPKTKPTKPAEPLYTFTSPYYEYYITKNPDGVRFDVAGIDVRTGKPTEGVFTESNEKAAMAFAKAAAGIDDPNYKPKVAGEKAPATWRQENKPPALDLPTIEHDGDTWHVLSTGAEKDGKVYAHLSSATRGKAAKNGIHPASITDLIDPAKIKQPEGQAANPQIQQGTIGMKLATGEVVLTSSGRETSPFPKVGTGSAQATSKSLVAIDEWLMQNAIDEAASRGDDFNGRVFQQDLNQLMVSKKKLGALPQASKDSAEEYLFGQQPPVLKPLLKPLINPGKPDKPKSPGAEKIEKADQDIADALGELGDIFGKSFRMNITPEQEQKLMPVLTKLMDAAFRKGYYKFKDAARFVLNTIRAGLGNDVADQVNLQHLQGAYIGMSGKYADQGADGFPEVGSVKSISEIEHVQHSSEPTTADSGSGASENKSDAGAVSNEPGRPTARTGRSGKSAGRPRNRGASNSRLPNTVPATDGKPGNNPVRNEEGRFKPKSKPAGSNVDQSSADNSAAGVQPDPIPNATVETVTGTSATLAEKLERQRNAEGVKAIPGDRANIDKTLPFLQEGQREDVHFAETRWLKPDGYGVLFTNGTGTGKAQPLDARILTPKGWVLMGDIKVGDKVISVDGSATKVIGVYPQGEKEIFSVETSDGAKTECCDEHLWLTQTLYERRKSTVNTELECAKPKVRALSEIRGSLSKGHFLPIVNEVEFSRRDDLVIPAYTMGALLGDGCFRRSTPSISAMDSEIIDRIKGEIPSSMIVTKQSTEGRCDSWSLSSSEQLRDSKGWMTKSPFQIAIDSLGLANKMSEEKHIPDAYLFSSVENRLALLQGLMDTDGYAESRSNSSYFSTSSALLASDVISLIRSLGGIASISSKNPKYRHNGEERIGKSAYTIHVSLPNKFKPFSISRKTSKISDRKYLPKRKIVDVVSVGRKQAQCIAVDHPSHLYVTDGFIVTHNTYLGLGAIKRMVKQGKKEGIIVVPNEAVINEWIKSAPSLGLTLNPILDTKDAGAGVSITTYANFRGNDELAKRKFDFVAIDEAHELMKSQSADITEALRTLRAVTMHPGGAFARYQMLNRDDIDKLGEINDKITSYSKAASNNDTMDEMRSDYLSQVDKLELQRKPLQEKLDKSKAAIKEEVGTNQGEKRTRALFLSATPFAYMENVEWASGFLFQYPEVGESRGYNQPNAYQKFMIEHFGYRMRTGKLTKPDAQVDQDLMQRNFNTWMRKEGALSARMLDVDKDYERKFILIDSAVGQKIDEGLKWLREAENGRYRSIYNAVSDRFDYLSRARLLEAIKAQAVIPIIKQHHALGRKVVVFYDFNTGGGMNVFDSAESIAYFKFILKDVTVDEKFLKEHGTEVPVIGQVKSESTKELQKERVTNLQLWQEFAAARKDLQGLNFAGMNHPLATLLKEFPDAGVYNGMTEYKKTRIQAIRNFNDDNLPGANVLMVQKSASAGWSGHDTTGNHHRVLINLGQPTAPIDAIQQEGRIYRVGQASDANFQYLNTGTNWERFAFATKISRRAGTAENLAMGEQARGLRESFIQAFEDSDPNYIPSTNDGKGGKALDRELVSALTEFDRAKSYYYGQQKRTSRNKSQEGSDYFATPEPLGLKMVEWGDGRFGDSYLEPSAGHGAIARWFPELNNRTVIEPSMELASRLAMATSANLINESFEDHNIINKYQVIVMNPPFGSGGKTAIEHLAKAFRHLPDTGRVVCLLPDGPSTAKHFDKWFNGETEKAVKPLFAHHTLGNVYKGDTVKTSRTWMPEGKVTRVDDSGVWITKPGSGSETAMASADITSVQSTGKRTQAVKNAPGAHLISAIDLPAGVFERAGTGVKTQIFIIDKIMDKAFDGQIERINLTGAKDVKDLFDQIEHLSVPNRQVSEKAQQPNPVGNRKTEVQVADAKAKQSEASAKESGVIVENKDDATFEKVGDKILTNAPAEQVTTSKGKVLDGVFVKDEAMAKAVDKFTYRPNGRDGGWFVRLRHIERPAVGDTMLSRGVAETINIDGVDRQTHNSEGKLIADSEKGIRTFYKWFGDSRVTDDKGRPLIVYHGSPDVRGIFSEGFKALSRGEVFFATDRYATANSYTDPNRAFDYQNAEEHVIPLYVALKNPTIINANGKHWKETESQVKKAKKDGSDGIIIKNSVDHYINDSRSQSSTVYAFFNATQAKSALDDALVSRTDKKPIAGTGPNNGDFNPGSPNIRLSRGEETKSAYESRIDALYKTDKPIGAIKVLDRGDMLDLLGYRSEPIYLNEKKVIEGKNNHGLSEDDWKKIPEWLDNPVYVFDSYTVQGRLVAVAPELVDGKPVYIILDPNYKLGRLSVQLLVNAYDDNKPNLPFTKWLNDGLLRYENNELARSLRTTKGLQLPNVVHAKNKLGFKILHKPDLVKYHQQNNIVLSNNSVISQGIPTNNLQKMVDRIAGEYKGLPKVNVLSNISQAPERLQAEVASQGASKTVEGAMHGGEIYLFADNLSGIDRAEFVLAEHEATHIGLRGLLGADLNREMNKIYRDNAKVRKLATEYQKLSPVSNAVAVEEVLADMTSEELAELKGWRGLVAKLAEWFRSHGFSRVADMLTSDETTAQMYAAELVKRARERVKTDGAASNDTMLSIGNPYQAAKAKIQSLINPETIDKLIYEFQDKYIDLKRLRDHIKEIGGTINDLNDGYEGETRYHGRMAKRTKDFLNDELKPVIAGLRHINVGMDEFEKFLHARHAPEANAEMATRNPTQLQIDVGQQAAKVAVDDLQNQLSLARKNGSATKAIEQALELAQKERMKWRGAQAFKGTEAERLALSGMTNQASRDIIDNMAPAKRLQMELLASLVDDINNKTLDMLEKYGLMSRDAIDAWRKTYKHYVPLHRDEAHPDSTSHPIGQGFSTRGDASKQRVGSNEKVTHILGHIAMQREAAITRGEKNTVMKQVYLMARQNPLADYWSTSKIPMVRSIDDNGFVHSYPDPTYKQKPNVLMLRVAGVDTSIIFNEHNPEAVRLAQSMKNLDVDDLHYIIPWVGKATRWLASVNTQYNPIFGIINLMRDVQTGALNLSTTRIAGDQAKVMKNTLQILGQVVKNKGRLPTTGPWAALRNEFDLVGGSTGYRDLFLDPKERSEALLKELNALDRGKISQAAHAIVDWLSDYNEAMENSVRLAAYKAGKDAGMTNQRSAVMAKNLTVNFNRKGRQTRELGALFAFFNAALQGTARMSETLSGPAGKKIIAGGVMLGATNALLGMAMMGGGGGDDDNWEKIPEFIKERSIIIPISSEDYLTIPMPLGFNFLPNIGRIAVEAVAAGGKDIGKQMASLAGVIADAFNPLGSSSDLGQMITPTFADPVVALWRNKDWTGKPIYKENLSTLDPSPGFNRKKNTATPWSYAMAEAINTITGGTEYTPGGWSPTPDQIDFIIGQLTGGVGRELGKVADIGGAMVDGEEIPAYKIPLAGRLYGNTRGQSGQSEKFYENLIKANEIENEIKGRVSNGISPSQFLTDNPNAASMALMGNAYENRIKKLREIKSSMIKQDMPKDQTKLVDARITESMKEFNKKMADYQR